MIIRKPILLALVTLLTCLAFALSGAAAGKSGAKPRPNVIFLLSDDQRFDTIHALGNEHIRTPNLDRLVESGTAFTHAHIMGGTQGAVCVPSRAMILTGRTLFRAGVLPSSTALAVTNATLPETLGRAGYTAIGIGKWHNDRLSFVRSFTQGGPVFFGGMSDHDKIRVFDYDNSGKYPTNRQYQSAKYSTELFADSAVEFLQKQAKDRPFFLYVAFTSPHDPRTPPKEFERLYDPEKIPLPKNFLPEHPFDNGEIKIRDEKLLPWPRTPQAVQKEIALYYAMISHLDTQIGRVLESLQKAGLAENTIIVFAGDNGLAVGQHGLLGKQNVYDHSIRVPLVMSGPGIPRGARSDALCYLFDVFPTLCELSQTPVPASVEGRSLVPVLRGERKQVRDSVFAAYRHLHRTVRDERWKLIEYPQIKRSQLFDLLNDPLEMKDLSADAAHAGRLDSLRKRLRQWQEETGDPLLQAGAVRKN